MASWLANLMKAGKDVMNYSAQVVSQTAVDVLLRRVFETAAERTRPAGDDERQGEEAGAPSTSVDPRPPLSIVRNDQRQNECTIERFAVKSELIGSLRSTMVSGDVVPEGDTNATSALQVSHRVAVEEILGRRLSLTVGEGYAIKDVMVDGLLVIVSRRFDVQPGSAEAARSTPAHSANGLRDVNASVDPNMSATSSTMPGVHHSHRGLPRGAVGHVVTHDDADDDVLRASMIKEGDEAAMSLLSLVRQKLEKILLGGVVLRDVNIVFRDHASRRGLWVHVDQIELGSTSVVAQGSYDAEGGDSAARRDVRQLKVMHLVVKTFACDCPQDEATIAAARSAYVQPTRLPSSAAAEAGSVERWVAKSATGLPLCRVLLASGSPVLFCPVDQQFRSPHARGIHLASSLGTEQWARCQVGRPHTPSDAASSSSEFMGICIRWPAEEVMPPKHISLRFNVDVLITPPGRRHLQELL